MKDPRYINANALNLYDDLFMKRKNDSGVWVRYKDVENMLKNAPTADVEEVKHEEWIERGIYSFKCSACGEVEKYESPYCRWCGAKMDGKESNE